MYLWESQQLKSLLTPEQYAVVSKVWRLNQARPFEYGFLPIEHSAPNERERALLDQAYATLRTARKSRGLPLDTKLNAGLNGLALSAFARGQALHPSYKTSAVRLRQFIERDLVRGDQLVKARTAKRVILGAELEDYAYVVQGLLDYADVNRDARAHTLAQKLARTAWTLFWGPTGWKRESQSLLATLPTEAVIADGALASPSEILMLASLQSGDTDLAQQVKRAATWQSPAMNKDPFAYPTRIRVLRAVSPAR